MQKNLTPRPRRPQREGAGSDFFHKNSESLFSALLWNSRIQFSLRPWRSLRETSFPRTELFRLRLRRFKDSRSLGHSTRAEQGRADPHHRCAFFDGHFKIAAHAHAQMGQRSTECLLTFLFQFAQAAEMRTGI